MRLPAQLCAIAAFASALTGCGLFFETAALTEEQFAAIQRTCRLQNAEYEPGSAFWGTSPTIDLTAEPEAERARACLFEEMEKLIRPGGPAVGVTTKMPG